MNILIWIANHALWISLTGALCAAIVRFEKLLSKRLHKLLITFGLFVGFATPLLGLLKKSVDDQWRAEMQRQIADVKIAALPKPFKARFIDFLNNIDTNLVPVLKIKDCRISGIMREDQHLEWTKLTHDPEFKNYITIEKLKDDVPILEMNTEGNYFYHFIFHVKKELLSK